MKKRLISVFFAAMLVAGLTITTELQSKANESGPQIDGSYLTWESESTGIAGAMTRGVDLQIGYSKIRELGPELIYVGGTTIAQHDVELVKVAVMVERIKDEDGEWEFVDSWQKENENTYSVSTSRRMEVEGDWYYRVRCTHSAGNDMSSSYTDGIYIHPANPGAPEEDEET